MKYQIRFVIGNKKWSHQPITIQSGLNHLINIAQAKKELKGLVGKIYGTNGWGKIEKAKWEKVWET